MSEQKDEFSEYWEMFPDVENITCYLYRKNGEQINRYRGTVVEPHDVGMEFGAGDYRMIIRGKEITKTVTFSLGENYNELRDSIQAKKNKLSGNAVQNVDIAGQVAAGVSKAIAGIMNSLSPVLPQLLESIRPKEITFGSALEKTYESMNRILEANMKKSLESVTEFKNQLLQNSIQGIGTNHFNDYEEDEEEDQEEAGGMSGLFNMVKPMLAQNMAGILAGNGEQLLSGIRNNSLFISLINNVTAMKEIQNWVLDEFGYDALNILMALLNQGNE